MDSWRQTIESSPSININFDRMRLWQWLRAEFCIRNFNFIVYLYEWNEKIKVDYILFNGEKNLCLTFYFQIILILNISKYCNNH